MVTLNGSVHRAAENVVEALDESGEQSQVWLLKRNCALSPRQVITFYLTLVMLSALISGGFALLGAWMVMPFAGLEMLVLGGALYVYARHATDHERVILNETRLTVVAVEGGKRTVTSLNPRLARIEAEPVFVKFLGHSMRIEAHRGSNDFRVGRIVLQECGRRVTIGRYIGEHQRRLFMQQLQSALALP